MIYKSTTIYWLNLICVFLKCSRYDTAQVADEFSNLPPALHDIGLDKVMIENNLQHALKLLKI